MGNTFESLLRLEIHGAADRDSPAGQQGIPAPTAQRKVRNQEGIMTELARDKSGLDEKVLLHELNHRINNEFAAAISAVSLAAARSANGEVKAALTGVTELLHHYADVHRALEMPEDETLIDAAAYLARLCLSINRSKLNDGKIRLVLSVQSLWLLAERCWLLGMILNELITNATRHAFVGGSGEIRIALWREGGFVKCSVWNSGSVTTNIQPGRGLKIVDALSKALGGCFGQRFELLGLTSLVVFPAGEPAAIAERARSEVVQDPERAVQSFDESPSVMAC
jgi:two-component sensor histidine kinase